MLGVGDSDWRPEGHFELSGSMRGWRLAADVGMSRRAMAWMVGWAERDMRAVRMWEPYDGV